MVSDQCEVNLFASKIAFGHLKNHWKLNFVKSKKRHCHSRSKRCFEKLAHKVNIFMENLNMNCFFLKLNLIFTYVQYHCIVTTFLCFQRFIIDSLEYTI